MYVDIQKLCDYSADKHQWNRKYERSTFMNHEHRGSVLLHLSRLTVRGDVDLVWQLGHVDLEAVLHVVQSLGVGLV